MPELYIITGSNGAGKSTVGTFYLPDYIRNNYTVFDGDKLFSQKQKELWLSGMRANKEVKKVAFEFVSDTFDQQVNEAIQSNDNYVYEGHFINDSTWDIPKRFREKGYIVNMIFLGLENPDLSEFRVIKRVEFNKGHSVPRYAIEDNFYGNLEKLNIYFPLINNLTIIDSSETEHIVLSTFSDCQVIDSVPYVELPEWFTKYLPALADKIKFQ